MLVLSRHAGEKIEFGDPDRDIVIRAGHPIVVTIVEVRTTDKVRVGIEADREIPVHRSEIAAAIRQEREGGAA